MKMPSGFTYGLFMAGVMFVLTQVAPQPAGSIAFWTALTVQAAFGGWIIWRRLRLRWFGLGAVSALCLSLVMIPISARGLNLATIATELPLWAVGAIWLGVLFVPLSVGLESWRNTPEWRAWSARGERATLWEVITLRHVPDMRSSRSPE
jgi:hypothetical protein